MSVCTVTSSHLVSVWLALWRLHHNVGIGRMGVRSRDTAKERRRRTSCRRHQGATAIWVRQSVSRRGGRGVAMVWRRTLIWRRPIQGRQSCAHGRRSVSEMGASRQGGWRKARRSMGRLIGIIVGVGRVISRGGVRKTRRGLGWRVHAIWRYTCHCDKRVRRLVSL